ncbi:MAG TPA: RnfABCDGE type electron transport complex subunit B [Paenalcaligenes sp.]|nr:RnfABCDGE type electron transport complex subunit B [Paenalcaligenes sp.]
MSASTDKLVQAINDVLPQTQCTRCGYDACLPYAQAIATQGEAINRCPPGGDEGIEKLAQLTGQPVTTLDPECGSAGPVLVAVIDEAHCIGCTLCIQACPVDAIIGANKLMHTIIPDYCTGCELCVAPCPVDCIEMRPTDTQWTPALAQLARHRYERRQERLSDAHGEDLDTPAARLLSTKPELTPLADSDADERQARIAAALQAARARRKK